MRGVISTMCAWEIVPANEAVSDVSWPTWVFHRCTVHLHIYAEHISLPASHSWFVDFDLYKSFSVIYQLEVHEYIYIYIHSSCPVTVLESHLRVTPSLRLLKTLVKSTIACLKWWKCSTYLWIHSIYRIRITMKSVLASILTLASLATAGEVVTEYTTYETVTTCPITSTYVTSGS